MAITVPDYSIGFTQEEVEEIFAVQKSELKKTLASYSESNSQVIKRKLEDINAIIAACQKALQSMDPDNYGKRSQVSVSRVTPNLEK